jgi:uncharacterized protein with FMN-binding domain
MKKLLLAGFVVFTYIIYSVHQRGDGSTAIIAPKAPTMSQTTQTPSSPGSTTTSATPSSGVAYKDGQYTGSVADAYYGNVEVKATVQGGKITDVTFLQYPNDRSTSVRINSQAMPYLKQEAITAQSATVDGVSGATYTSQAFIESLTSALSSARS